MAINDKVHRGLSAIARAAVARDHRLAEQERRRQGLVPFRCAECGRLLFEYAPPIGRVLLACRRCGAWGELITEAHATTV